MVYVGYLESNTGEKLPNAVLIEAPNAFGNLAGGAKERLKNEIEKLGDDRKNYRVVVEQLFGHSVQGSNL